jgi:hypothetical protein
MLSRVPDPDPDQTGRVWIERVHQRGSDDERGRAALGRLIAEDPDPAEVEYYETLSDPDLRAVQKAQRSFAGQYLRRQRDRDQRR